ncbi:two pore domain potassium channel family protein [Actinotalea sp. BY-33]|uniref:Two pore domain potassium channel family protein n=1 Tax=Actinotalea soli TaxID=2819234 RepID=A0A939RWI0_9CELL|nr:potassium channel family protein [Actinotalea soli]MBO1752648.1 two pore domain potassium channel family protein [Actinotalea soli]
MPTLLTALGALLVLVTLRDVFHALWRPAGSGTLSVRVMRAVWWVGERPALRRILRPVVGPAAMVVAILVWTALVTLGWALIYLPAVPEGLVHASGIDPLARGAWAEALYLSLVTLATLGYGDVVPAAGWLLLAAPLQALVGFALLTAAVSWIGQVHPAVTRRRVLAARAHALGSAGLSGHDQPPAAIIAGVASGLAAVRVDLEQYDESYYFHDLSTRSSLADALGHLDALAVRAVDDPDGERRWAGRCLVAALDDLAETLDERFLHTGGDRDEVFEAYRRERGTAARR